MKTKYTKTIVLILATILTFGFITANKSKTALLFQTPEERILGVWVMENSPADKLEFLANGKVKKYIDNVLKSTYIYSLTNECNGEVLNNNQLFLKITFPEGDSDCSYVNGIDENNSGVLSLTTSGQGKLVVYLKQ